MQNIHTFAMETYFIGTQEEVGTGQDHDRLFILYYFT